MDNNGADKKIKVTKDRNYVNMQVNPCKMCMPMGASMALKGFSRTMNIIHGSQGCSTYIRRHMAAHYNEPVDIASSSLSEEGTVYGGSKNLKLGIKNLVDMYRPDIVGVLTTCLAETIGDDIERIVKEVRELAVLKAWISFPYRHPVMRVAIRRLFSAIRSILKYYSTKIRIDNDLAHQVVPSYEGEHVNVVVSNATCEDIREIKRILKIMEIEAVVLPDISDVLDAPYREEYDKLNEDGLSREELMRVLTQGDD